MPEYTLKSLGDVACIGILEIPALDLELPVISSWSYSSLQVPSDPASKVMPMIPHP